MYKDLKKKRVLVLGLGLHGSGVAVARFLVRAGAYVTVSDKKNKSELALSLKIKNLSIKYVLGEHPESLLQNCDLIVQNPVCRLIYCCLNKLVSKKYPLSMRPVYF